MAYRRATDPEVQRLVKRFGEDLRRCRLQAGMSQRELERRTGVDQTLISRLERGLAPFSAIIHLMRLNDRIGRWFPLGTCPHDHACPLQRPDPRHGPSRPRGTTET